MIKGRKIGAPVKNRIYDAAGKEVPGLSFDEANNTYFASYKKKTGKWHKKYFGTDKDEAIFKYRFWVAQKHSSVEIKGLPPESVNLSAQAVKTVSKEQLEAYNRMMFDLGGEQRQSPEFHLNITPEDAEHWAEKGYQVGVNLEMIEPVFWQTVRTLILTDIHDARRKLNLPGLYIEDAPKIGKSVSLKEIGEFYLKRKLCHRERKNCELVWKDFCDVVGVKTISEVMPEHIDEYYDQIWNQYEDKELSTSWIYGRFTKPKTILNYFLKRGRICRDDVQKVKNYCMCLTPPRRDGQPAQAISREHLNVLLKNADTKWQLIYLLAINCGYYPSSLALLKKEHIKHKDDMTYIVFPRPKNQGIRIAVLFDETISALNKYLETNKHQSDYLFLNANGSPHRPNHLRQVFVKQRDRLKLPRDLKFNHFRDGTASAMFGRVADKDVRNVVLGHRIGDEESKYITLNPKMVKCCTDAVHEEYLALPVNG